MKINEDYLDDIETQETISSEESTSKASGLKEQYPLFLEFQYFNLRFEPEIIKVKLENYLDSCPFILSFSEIDITTAEKRISGLTPPLKTVAFGFEHRFKSAGSLFRFLKTVTGICFKRDDNRVITINIQPINFRYQALEEFQIIANGSVNLETPNLSNNGLWGGFLEFCAHFFGEYIDAYKLMQRSFPWKDDWKIPLFYHVDYIKANYKTLYNLKSKRFDISGKFIDFEKLQNYIAGNKTGVFVIQRIIEEFSHTKVHFTDETVPYLKEIFTDNKAEILFSCLLTGKDISSQETLNVLMMYVGATKEKYDNLDYRYTSVAVTSKLTPEEIVEKICS